MTEFGAIVLCGGESRRMGRAKAWLPFGEEFLLQRIVRIVSVVCSPVVVVRAANQLLPPLPSSVRIVDDERDRAGPLAGLERGSKVLTCEKIFLVSCDVPLLDEGALKQVCSGLIDGTDVALPVVEGQRHPVFAAYRRSLLPVITRLLNAGDRKMMTFLSQQNVRQIRDVPYDALRNINTPSDYEEVLQLAAEKGLISSSQSPSASDS